MNRWIEIGTVSMVMILIMMGAFSFILNSPLDHNEHMYIAAGKLWQTEKLYTDFAFLQMPYIAIFYGLVFKLLGSGWYLLVARLCSFFFFLTSGILVFLIARGISKNRFLALLALILFSFNEVVILTMKEASNYNMALAFSLLGLYLFCRNIRAKRQNSWAWAWCGMVLALTAGIKLYYVFSIIPFLIVVLLFSKQIKSPDRTKKVLFPFGLGLFIGILPLVYFLLRDFDNFVFNNLGYHFFNSLYFFSLGFKTGMAVPAKFSYFFDVFKLNSNLAILLGLGIFLFFVFFMGSKRKNNLSQHTDVILMLLLVLFSAVALFFLTPLWIQYFSFPLPFLILLVVYLYSIIPENRKSISKVLLGVVGLLAVVSGGVRLFNYVDRLARVNDWMVVKLHHNAEMIKKNISDLKNGEKIATFSPIFVLDADLGIYNEFSTGPFLYRIGHLLSDDQLAEFKGVSPRALQVFLDKEQPRAFLIGHESHLERAFIQYARLNGYKKIKRNFYGLSLFVR